MGKEPLTYGTESDPDQPALAQQRHSAVFAAGRHYQTQHLLVGDLLPSEAELCRALDVSRNTVRQAIGELEEEGLVVRKRGKGTFVADPNTNRRGVRYSFTTEISSLGKVPSSTLVDFAVITPSREVCEKMDLHEGTSVYCFTRVRNVDGEPLILETSYYPKYIYPNLTRELVQTHSFYRLLYHVGITPFAADESYEAIILDADRARLLGVAAGSSAFYHQRRTKTEDGRIYEYTCSYIRGDRVRLEFDIPSRGIIGLRSNMLTATAGEAIMTHRLKDFEPWVGEIEMRTNGSIISGETGTAFAYSIDKLQDRGRFFINPMDQVYAGQVIGEHTRQNDITVNVTKAKQLTNMRASGSDDKTSIAPPKVFTLEEALEYIQADEYVEVTPHAMRLRKILLHEVDRKRASK